MDIIDWLDPDLKGASNYNVYRKGELIFSIQAVKSNNKITKCATKRRCNNEIT